MLRTNNFTVEILNNENEPDLSCDDRDSIMEALSEKKFTVTLVFEEFYEYDNLADGEIHVEPMPGY